MESFYTMDKIIILYITIPCILLDRTSQIRRTDKPRILMKLMDYPVMINILRYVYIYLQSTEYVYDTITERIKLRWFIEKPASYFTAYGEYPRIFVIVCYFSPQHLIATTFIVRNVLTKLETLFL